MKSVANISINKLKSGENVRPDENSQKPEQVNQSIIDDTQVGRDQNIGNITQNITINNSPSANSVRLKVFQAPPLPEYYVDRPEVSQDLKQRLLSDGGTLVISAIHGLGSVGKSTLAAALAHDADIQKHFCDGVLWATLGQEPDVLSLLGGWVQGLGDYNYRATSIEATSAHLNTLLFDKAVLLVVDDAWIDKNKGWEHVQGFKVGGDRCRMLVTTRDASIANFLGAKTYPLDVMTETQALELLTQKVETQGKRLQEDEIKPAKALAKAVGYLPLALELAASQVASGTSWKILIEDIQQEIARLKSFKDPGIRHISDDEKFKKLSLQASLNLSVKRLSENDRECFTWLGVLPEDANITPKMTATLWDMDERDARETLQYLRSQALLLSGVLLADETATYRLHDLFHDLARNLLTAPQKPKRQGDLVGLGMKWEDVHSRLLDKYQQQTENNLWHTLPDDGYIHQYLVWHLEKAGRIEEIHQILREESASGNNGWYEVRERFGQTAGFLTDVARAWELAETDWERKNLSLVLGLQCRYALIISSLSSLADNLPERLLVLLVEKQYWYPQQGLAYALQKRDSLSKINTLITLIKYLPESLKQQALQKAIEIGAHQIQNQYSRAQIISVFTKKLQDENLYIEALNAARQIPNPDSRAQILLVLAEKLQGENLYIEALNAARQIPNPDSRAEILLVLAEKLQDENLYIEVLNAARQMQHGYSRARILSLLVEKSQDENLYIEVLNAARQMQDGYSRAQILLVLAEKLQDENLYIEVLNAARQMQDEYSRAQILSLLVEKSQDESLYIEVLNAVCQIQHGRSRAQILSLLVEKSQDESLYIEVLNAARQMQDGYSRVQILSVLAEKLQDSDLYTEALNAAHQIQDEYSRVQILSVLAEKLQDENLYIEVLNAARRIQNEDSRAEILLVLAEKLQDENLYIEALNTVCQIQTSDSRAKVISVLAEKLQYKNLYSVIIQNENLYSVILEIARQLPYISYNISIFNVMKFVAKKLQNKNFIDELLPLIHKIPNKEYQIIRLIELAEYLEDKNIYNEALKLSRQIEDERFRAQTLGKLAQKIQDKEIYAQALVAVNQMQDANLRDLIVRELAEGMKQEDFHTETKDDSVSFPLWLAKIKSLSRQNRQDVQEQIQKLVSVIFNLGGKEAIAEVASAIQDVGRWWR
ncbi:NB-ARC domain-containing protein [Scytonema sp. NUACC21]